ncbi:DUF2612 domain-containing protein [Pandoraea sputorum]|uniref:Protein of uncharacterized function (DUF2612) n=1 Tax=Pandoraea sputorum TaxID=93222 RepID=A0A239SFX0_9BURK|nr:DUF2612 domain-containing protein [Pandoraea sputorum]AJC16818.1 hypothetical protein NA29_13850 [Pandoraea sputorum]SNU84301.1 Protein of uncharacterised function (DUF2612) [Pandoraea sputorum]VVD90090.1 bacteriophage protein [Pandoraea sputorum]
MADITDYTGKLTSEHADKPRYAAMVRAVTQCFVDVQDALASLPASFDLDSAIGKQLDGVGLWVGVSRNIRAPLSGVYFSFDTAGLGLDQGVWRGPFDPDTGVTTLDDETYRLLIRARIGANHWDGTLAGSKAILSQIFNTGTHVFIQDNQDMSITVGISGKVPSALFLALLSGGYIPIKPQSVRISFYIVTSVSDSPIFGFDMSNEYVAGFDSGAWATPL